MARLIRLRDSSERLAEGFSSAAVAEGNRIALRKNNNCFRYRVQWRHIRRWIRMPRRCRSGSFRSMESDTNRDISLQSKIQWLISF